MAPIDGLSEIVRIPRLGKIHLGMKVSPAGVEYPKPTDYFVVPDEVKAVYGDEPKELDIMFPVEDPNLFAQQWLRAYSMTQGLVCIGDGQVANRKTDKETGWLATHETKDWEWKELICDYEECPEYVQKRCRRVMNLQVLLPKVPGLGVYQIDTSSRNSIININSMIKMLQGLGRCRMIPLTLVIGPLSVSPPGQTTKTVYVMHIKKDNIKLADIAQMALLPAARALLPEPETEEAPDDLFPAQVLAESEEAPASTVKPKTLPPIAAADKRKPTLAAATPKVAEAATKRNPADIKKEDVPSLQTLKSICQEIWGMSEDNVAHELGYKLLSEVTMLPWECFLSIKSTKEEPWGLVNNDASPEKQ